MGLIGFGRIGRRTGALAHAFEMNVIAADVVHGKEPDYTPFSWKEIPNVFAKADVISLHCPQTEDNIEFVNAKFLGHMKPSAFLINTSRGSLINEQDLAHALNAAQLADAAVDVVSVEPICPDNPLLNAKNCIITPHMAWGTLAARRRLMKVTADNVNSFLGGTPT